MTPEATSEAVPTAVSGSVPVSSPDPAPAPQPARKEQRVTRQRRAVSAALDALADFVSTQELHRVLHDRGESVSLATTYRILQSMADDGLVDVLRNGDNEAVYRRCAVEHHHHHLLCRNCGRAVEVEAPAVEQWAARIAAEHGFTDAAHTVEIHGVCPDCAALAAGS
ncbi:Fur family transcriptional regulator [Arthrobacter burdickii]|jgi:Fur family ferric uptake transcriptional regulator|uniref:Fur family transcriptional regulator n=1 Tax=Arthrobacter burdickii TaxID=3035920 RepID=A0ABT8K107_9MICC|nr:Fur family transcriptional regulator [Arthrobacter burdickii]MDN4611118.1 Fur family transcriptional regulator [Arthrobacter burdickii]